MEKLETHNYLQNRNIFLFIKFQVLTEYVSKHIREGADDGELVTRARYLEKSLYKTYH